MGRGAVVKLIQSLVPIARIFHNLCPQVKDPERSARGRTTHMSCSKRADHSPYIWLPFAVWEPPSSHCTNSVTVVGLIASLQIEYA
jgi:hypothetical protein